jgi:hypothetical protein
MTMTDIPTSGVREPGPPLRAFVVGLGRASRINNDVAKGRKAKLLLFGLIR